MTSDQLQAEILLELSAGRKPGKLGRLYNVVVKYRDEGGSQEAAMLSIEALRSRLAEADDDTLLELLDFVFGWCKPELQIWPKKGGEH